LVVSNINPADPSAVIQGNERVVRPRLADAKFFFDQDRKKTLESRTAGLGKVVYHNLLGTQAERSDRVAAIAHAVVEQLRLAQTPYTAEAKDEFDVLNNKAQQAARLAKTDLLTDMVGEFPELQGVMGGYYARHECLRDGVAIAIEDHYKPRFAGDALPRNHTGTVLALADKLETLIGMFGIGNLPTGDKDPFALRRHALGVVRIVMEKGLALDMPALLAQAAASFGALLPDAAASNAKLLQFMDERMAGYLREAGHSAQAVDAVQAVAGGWKLIPARLDAVKAFASLPQAPALAAANKRIGNILKKAEAEGAVDAHINPALLTEDAEKDLLEALQTIVPESTAQFAAGQYTASLQTLAALRAPVDAFFDDVMVNAEQEDVRLNRLGLLKTLHEAMNRVADLSRLA
jgi:glycyl-tRNA synthetase beta chain